MKTFIYVWLSMFSIITVGVCALAFAETSISTGMRYDSFSDDQEGAGTELTIPLGAIYRRDRLFLRLETTYSRASVSSGADDDSEISNFTDTLLAGSYTFPDLPVGVILGLDLNLPTGKERLDTLEQAAEAGECHDLFEVDNFGEGVNIGLNLGMVKEFGPFNLLVSAAYIFKGAYNPTQDTSEDDLDPGDQTLGFAVLHWKAVSWLRVETMAAYSHFTPEKLDGQKSFQEGNKIVLGGNVRLQRYPLELTLGVQNALQGKNKELLGGTLHTEPDNSNGTEVFGWLDFTWRVSPQLDVQVLGDIRSYRESERKNEWNGLPFEGQRLRYAVGPGIRYVLNEHISWNVLAKFFRMEQERDFLMEQDLTFHGLNASVGVTYTF